MEAGDGGGAGAAGAGGEGTPGGAAGGDAGEEVRRLQRLYNQLGMDIDYTPSSRSRSRRGAGGGGGGAAAGGSPAGGEGGPEAVGGVEAGGRARGGAKVPRPAEEGRGTQAREVSLGRSSGKPPPREAFPRACAAACCAGRPAAASAAGQWGGPIAFEARGRWRRGHPKRDPREIAAVAPARAPAARRGRRRRPSQGSPAGLLACENGEEGAAGEQPGRGGHEGGLEPAKGRARRRGEGKRGAAPGVQGKGDDAGRRGAQEDRGWAPSSSEG